MIARDAFEGAVYDLLFPGGQLPLDLKHNLGLIDSRISEIHGLAQGKGPAPKTRRIMDPMASAELTRKIVELRDGTNSPSWRDIAKQLGNAISADAVRCRYQDYKTLRKKIEWPEGHPTFEEENLDPELQKIEELVGAPPALAEVKPEPAEIPTIRNPLIVEEVAEVTQNGPVLDLTKKGKYDRYEAPISPEVDAEIQRMALGGLTTVGISNELAKKGILISWQRVRSALATTARLKAKAEHAAHPEVVADPSPPGVEGTQALARAHPRGTPEEKPEPRSISRAERDLKIWDLHKAGKTPEEISDLIYAEGLLYDAKAVRRILLQQGAAL